MLLRPFLSLVIFASLTLAQSEKAPAPAPAAAPKPDDSGKRVELNLLGKEDASAGESRRNENVQFNLIDNNALKELNIRVGATATIVREFRPDLGYYGAEFGNVPAGGITIATNARAGWHGSAFYNHLNSIFTARSFFQVGDVKPARENRFGVSSGFSLWKGGYLSVQWAENVIRGQVNGNVLVPQPDERTPLTTDPALRAVVERFLAAYPRELPNRTDINPRALNTNSPQAITQGDGAGRLEQQLTEKDRLFAGYQFIGQQVDAFQLVAGQNPITTTKSHRARLTWLRQWSPATFTNFSAGFDRIGSLLVPENNAVGRMVSPAGLTTLGPVAIIPIDRAQNLFRYEGSWQSTRGSHTLLAGFQFIRRQFNGVETDAHRGYFGFSNDFGRSGIENLRWGTPTTFVGSVGDVRRGFRQWITQLYAGDTWRVTPQLTLQYGLRYEAPSHPYEINGLNTVPYGCDCNNFAPSFGIAYRLPERFGILRAAGTVAFSDILPVTYSQVRFSPPGSTKFSVPAPDLLDPLGSLRGEPRATLYELDPELTSPYAYIYNASWEPAFSSRWRVQFGYAGSRSHKLLIMWYRNRAHPVSGIPQTTATVDLRRDDTSISDIRWVLNGSRGYFDAARATVIVPRIAGFSLDASYWFSKAMDLGSDYTNTAYDADSRLTRSQWEYETHKDRRARSLFDQPHAFLARFAYESPQKKWQGWSGRFFNAWIFSGVLLLKQGTPFTVSTFDGPGFGNVDGNGGDRPLLLDTTILGRTVGNPETSVSMLPRSAFGLIQPTGLMGNLGVNVFRKGSIRNLNAALSRTWTVGGKRQLTFRAESINLSNTPQFAEPGTMLGTPEFGSITNTLNDGRTFRLGAQFAW